VLQAWGADLKFLDLGTPAHGFVGKFALIVFHRPGALRCLWALLQHVTHVSGSTFTGSHDGTRWNCQVSSAR
jgi:hypothetical protein